ncbi:hypothetical protein [Kineosporia succinea]|uniref:Uncharacterized protein n=1 Tax=Kineosporia succinea TaxID=84632 RepID=A0ABT9PES4_9ACTN|nr:hypothetical protein [Kineosporia succinea]MDP9830670.1 hypothetical protein [Kineosporia succinea]
MEISSRPSVRRLARRALAAKGRPADSSDLRWEPSAVVRPHTGVDVSRSDDPGSRLARLRAIRDHLVADPA